MSPTPFCLVVATSTQGNGIKKHDSYQYKLTRAPFSSGLVVFQAPSTIVAKRLCRKKRNGKKTPPRQKTGCHLFQHASPDLESKAVLSFSGTGRLAAPLPGGLVKTSPIWSPPVGFPKPDLGVPQKTSHCKLSHCTWRDGQRNLPWGTVGLVPRTIQESELTSHFLSLRL